MNRDEAIVMMVRDGADIRRPEWFAGECRQWRDGAVRHKHGDMVALPEADDYEAVPPPAPEPPPEPNLVEVEVDEHEHGSYTAYDVPYGGVAFSVEECAGVKGFGGYVYHLLGGRRIIAVSPVLLWCDECNHVRWTDDNSKCWDGGHQHTDATRALHPDAVLLPEVT